jgi:hypothetical protein
MLEEAQRLELWIENKEVNSWSLLREYFSKASGRLAISAMYDVAIGIFEISPGWMVDTEKVLLNYMGWEYARGSINVGKNKLGNGCVQKVISRTKSDARAILRLCCFTGRSKYKLNSNRLARVPPMQ